MSEIRFAKYEHRMVYGHEDIMTKYFIVLKDCDGNILGWTDYHKYVRGGKKKKARSRQSNDEKRYKGVVKFLNYIFFGKYNINKLTDLTVDMVKEYLNDFGLCNLPDDDEDTHRGEDTVNKNVGYIIDFIDLLSRENKLKFKVDDLYRTEKVFNKRKKRYETIKVPVFEVNYDDYNCNQPIFRDITEGAFQIIMDEIATHNKNLLMLAALGAFAGLRPGEACNVRREDSALGPGITFIKFNDEIEDIKIDLDHRKNLRSDLVKVGGIKKPRPQRVYPPFIEAFMDCYGEYMKYIEGRPYEAQYGALTNTSTGMAYTYDAYRKAFKSITKKCIPIMLASEDPKTVNYGHLLQEHSISPHIFRHWFSVKLVLYGEDVAGIKYWRGDKSPESALTYLNNKSELVKQFEAVSDSVFNYNMWRANKMIKNTVKKD